MRRSLHMWQVNGGNVAAAIVDLLYSFVQRQHEASGPQGVSGQDGSGQPAGQVPVYYH